MIRKKVNKLVELWRELLIVMISGRQIPLLKIKIRCPLCGSARVSTNGSRPRKNGRVEAFICKNPNCKNGKKKTPKQFVASTSFEFKEFVRQKLKPLYEDLLIDGAKFKTIAKKYKISVSSVSALRKELQKAIENHYKQDSLVGVPQPDKAVAIDETFLTIEGKTIYVILATGYQSRKTLGLKVSTTRNESDLREVFDEAERNAKQPFVTVTSDAWGATIAMVRNLGRAITHIVHKHKKPFDKTVIKRHEYTETERITTDIGVKVDVTKRRATREGHYLETRTSLTPLPQHKRGRPKGSKTTVKKTRPTPAEKEKRGKKGLFKVFEKGKKFYFKVDPYKKTIKTKKNLPAAVAAGLSDALNLFALKSIQNNIAENITFVLRMVLGLSGPKTMKSIEQRIRGFLYIRNDPNQVGELRIERNIHGTFYKNNLDSNELLILMNGVWMV